MIATQQISMIPIPQISPIGQKVAAGFVRSGGVQEQINVGNLERWGSVLLGSVLAFKGLENGKWPGLGLAAVGGCLVYRGLSGHCALYSRLGINTYENHSPAASVQAGRGVKVTRAVTIQAPAAKLYAMWRDLEKLPRFMQHLVSVKEQGDTSLWEARAPKGATVSWEAEIVNEERSRLIAWRSLEGSEISTAGSVHFQHGPAGRGTEVTVSLKYDPPAGKLGSWIAWLFGKEPGQQIAEDLRRFKQLVETGEIATTEGQTSCRAAKSQR